MIELKDNVLECDWINVLSFANSTSGKDHAKNINYNMKNAPYPLTSTKLNQYYLNTNFGLKSVYGRYNCAADMYSYFLNTFQGVEGQSWSTGATGANPYGVIPQRTIDLTWLKEFIEKYGIPIALIIFGFVIVNKVLD